MSMPDEMLHEVGRYEPIDAKKLLAAFEARGVPFEIEADHSALHRPERTLQLNFGMYPEGSKMIIFVPASALERAQAIVAELFPL